MFAKEALVVGVKNYANSPLRNTLNDANDVAAKLKEMGFRVELSLDPTLKDFDKAQDRSRVDSVRASSHSTTSRGTGVNTRVITTCA